MDFSMNNPADLWFAAVHDFNETVATARTLPPFALGILLLPCVLAVLSRSVTAFLLTALLAIVAVPAMRSSLEDPNRWLALAVIILSAFIGVALAYMLRQARLRLRNAESQLGEVQRELRDLIAKHEGEVRWRKAAEMRKT
jgi:type VI protein secretion system component VasK